MSETEQPEGATKQLCDWISNLSLPDIPAEKLTRAKYFILDGLACALIGAHLPWSDAAVTGVLSIESEGKCGVIGWEKKTGPLAAGLLNSTFIQGFELDDYHSKAPIHSNSIVLPTLLAVLEQGHDLSQDATNPRTGAEFLLATVVGYETGPRVGLGIYGFEVLSRGWHSGAIFGPAASAAAATKFLQLPSDMIEDAIGIACTQACGLMSAQYESTVKRMQHGFATRNGLFAAFMASTGYKGIKQVLERPYGGYLSVFSLGNGRTPQYMPERVVEELGVSWDLDNIVIKPYASMAATHATIDGLIALQAKYPQEMAAVDRIRHIKVEMSEALFKKGGWAPKRPITATGAQMAVAYAAAMQLLERSVQPAQFAPDQLERDDVWMLMDKIQCVHNLAFDVDENIWQQRVSVEVYLNEEDQKQDTFTTLTEYVVSPRGIGVPLSNEEIFNKWRSLTTGIISEERQKAIETMILDLENVQDMRQLCELLYERTKNVFDTTS
ncbi:2-methylcitrate dehydratase PrpD [Penicillium malachiteum]|uniref:2-methylcitrate dehydratase PrpD n=1 Tax=Penicillium malachiteum TaxID=1324776 RepID=UPI002548B31E|nr:2-methylcitrate dehydratase PrpD [Penicillium malachiteum]KAJ5736986.1 2-methylcitrate dehydratase PrpD [Penicillium malachiteum]